MKNEIIKVPSKDLEFDKNFLTEFNQKYRADFSVVGIEEIDGTKFTLINAGSSGLFKIFRLAERYGMRIEKHKEKQGNYDYFQHYSPEEEVDTVVETITGNLREDKRIVEEFNEVYGTRFRVIGSETRDGTEFAFIETNGNDLNQIFMLGIFIGRKIEAERLKDPIYAELINKAHK